MALFSDLKARHCGARWVRVISTLLAGVSLSAMAAGPVADVVYQHGRIYAVDQTGTDYKFDAAPVLKSVPKATWSKAVALNPGIATANTQPATIDRVLTGFSLRPTVLVPDQLSPIDLKPLQFTADPAVRHFDWATPDAPPADQFGQANAMKQFTASLANTDVVGKARDALIAALQAHKVADLADATIDVTQMAKSASEVLLSPPVLSYLGDQRKAA